MAFLPLIQKAENPTSLLHELTAWALTSLGEPLGEGVGLAELLACGLEEGERPGEGLPANGAGVALEALVVLVLMGEAQLASTAISAVAIPRWRIDLFS